MEKETPGGVNNYQGSRICAYCTPEVMNNALRSEKQKILLRNIEIGTRLYLWLTSIRKGSAGVILHNYNVGIWEINLEIHDVIIFSTAELKTSGTLKILFLVSGFGGGAKFDPSGII